MASDAKDTFRKSDLLTAEENDQIKRMLGKGCQGLATGVVQIFVTQPPDHDEWVKYLSGVICLVKDNPKRSYFLRLFCLKQKAKVWEFEIYKDMLYHCPRPFLHVFVGQDRVVAVDFASKDEAERTYEIIRLKLDRCKQKEIAAMTKPDDSEKTTDDYTPPQIVEDKVEETPPLEEAAPPTPVEPSPSTSVRVVIDEPKPKKTMSEGKYMEKYFYGIPLDKTFKLPEVNDLHTSSSSTKLQDEVIKPRGKKA